jgi:ERCC4-type nuclease
MAKGVPPRVPLRVRRSNVPKQKEEAEYIDEANDFDETIKQPYFVAPPSGRLIVKRDGHSITREIPKPIVLIDTREQVPLTFSRFPNWIAGEKRQKLKIGDYSVQGMEHLLAIERKTLSDIATTVMQQRLRFFKMCEQLAQYKWRALLIEASYEDIKSPYDEENTLAHPNAVSGTLDALEARFGIPVIYTSRYRPLAEEKAASWLSKHFTYWYLDKNGFGRVLQEGDL